MNKRQEGTRIAPRPSVDIRSKEPNTILKNINIAIKAIGFSQHDCCSYTKCPRCGNDIDSWGGKCNCGQKYDII